MSTSHYAPTPYLPGVPTHTSRPADQTGKPAATNSVRLGVIDYLNVVPVYDWLVRRASSADGLPGLALERGVPAEMNRALAAGLIDVSNVSSVAFGRSAREWLLLPGLSVAAHGRVQSVLLFSWQADWRALDGARIALTNHSATSVALTKLLAEMRYGVSPRYETCAPDLAGMLATHEAALLIGDIALREYALRRPVAGRGVPYVFDLAAEWEAWQGLPFVFAVWAARAEAAEAVRRSGVATLLRASKERGLADLDRLAREAAVRLDLPEAVCAEYLRLLDYELSSRDLEGLRVFLELAVPGFRWSDVRLLSDDE